MAAENHSPGSNAGLPLCSPACTFQEVDQAQSIVIHQQGFQVAFAQALEGKGLCTKEEVVSGPEKEGNTLEPTRHGNVYMLN